MTQFDVIGFGALNVDKLYKVNRIANAEEESFIENYAETCGGSAANTIVGLARLGCKTGFIGKVGSDRESKMLIQDLCIEGVNIEGIIQASKGKSGMVLGFIDRNGDRALYVDPGENDNITFNEINRNFVNNTRFLHLSSFVGNESFESQKKLLEVLPDSIKVTFDPGILYANRGFDAIKSMIKKTNILMPNSNELKLLTKKSNYKEGAAFMIQQGIEIVAVKLGSSGSYVTNGIESYNVEPFEVDVVDTTGAGDAFCAGFISGLINEENLHDCARIGNFVASRKIMKLGARAGLPFTKDLDYLD